MDPNDLNSLSEVESLSDSDWLDIASSRASEENDSSFADSDASDREDLESDYRPPSRRSLLSNGSGDIQGWEGIVEDSADEAPVPGPVINGDEHAPASTLTDPRLSHLSLSFRAVALSESAVARHTALVDPEEEQKVKDALDQSMVSTLSGSRSNSLNGSVQTSVVHSRDLRLSFPDPLTSPRAESLNPSYENISVPTDTDLSPSDGDTLPSGLSRETTAASIDPAPAADPSTIDPTLEVARDNSSDDIVEKACVTTDVHSSSIVDFYIVLYGTSSEIKYRVVHALIEKLMSATGCGLSALSQMNVPHNIRMLMNGGRATHFIISIIDRTDSVVHEKEPATLALAKKPSLAVVFVPSVLTQVPEHTLYLPVLTQDTFEEEDDLFESGDRLLDAEHQWDSLCIPKDRLISAVFAASKSAVVEEEEIRRAPARRVARALRPLLPWTEAWSVQTLSSRHALTIFAILSMVLGYLINGSLPSTGHPATSTTEIVPRPMPPTPQVNMSTSMPMPTTSSTSAMALVSSSLKEFALAVLSPYPVASTSSVATKAVPSPTASAAADPAPEAGAPSECECGCGLITWPGKLKPETDVALRPTPPAPSIAGQTFHKGNFAFVPPTNPVKGKGKGRATEDDSLYALSTRIAGALTEYLDTCMAFAPSRHDVEEVVDALEELGEAIGKQTETALTQTKSMVDGVRQNIRARHERARSRAKEIRAAGERWFSSMTDVSTRMRDRVNTAKENARALRDVVAQTHARREEARRARQERWEARREHRRERRADRRARRAQTVG
ncbi:hypothetical protein PYCCODRAFT_1431596 [Trametes coccinea BRFM310]|uniref:Uncharacterized protein n=1 Tax=Trametes coccinea (strain BRFM310) TaxID=1353009 RepID=A0A1Y2J325_TRAC3|nr:hypothetical protein PYCCODRAFT_1431596 [Trametes coccinea BRFM310]